MNETVIATWMSRKRKWRLDLTEDAFGYTCNEYKDGILDARRYRPFSMVRNREEAIAFAETQLRNFPNRMFRQT